MSASAGRLVILSGPSCVGKTPVTKALKRLYPDLAAKLTPLVLYNSRAPRPGEQSDVDYHFRTREQVDMLRAEARYVVLDVRGDLQALDLDDLSGFCSAATYCSRATRSSDVSFGRIRRSGK